MSRREDKRAWWPFAGGRPQAKAPVMVRAATPGDGDAIAAMASALSLSEGRRLSRFTAEVFRRDGFGPAAMFHTAIAEIDGAAAGYAVFYDGYDTDSATRGVYLADLYVDAAHRRQGVGSALLAHVAACCRAGGGRWMFWSVLKRNRGARRFYRAVATELGDVMVCAAIGRSFDRLADRAPQPREPARARG